MSVRLMQQYHQMIFMVWIGCRFEGEALVRFERLQNVYCGRRGVRQPFRKEVYAA